ncbi:MAG: zinc-dependent alcohol dehydrogenase family protein [Gammaproteobacteria bacterium]
MKAVVMTGVGGPEVLEVRTLDKPIIKNPNEVLVRLKAAGVNPLDTKLRQGFYPIDELPAVLGCDGAGSVEAVADGVESVNPGDEVYFCHAGLGTLPGNYAEFTVVDEKFVAPKPASIDFSHAAAAPLVLLTAWESLHDRARIKTGQTVLIHAGAGGVGHVAIQLAKQAGARVLATVGSPEKGEFVRSLGAEEAILYKEQDFVEAVMTLTHGSGVDMVMDNVGGPVFQASFPAVRYYGDIVTLLPPGEQVDWHVARWRNLRISLEIMLTPFRFGLADAVLHQKQILVECASLIDQGALKIHVSQTLPLEQAAEAHRLIETGSTTGKLVLKIG